MLISFKDLFNKYNIWPTGILHIGASEGQEAQRYNDLGVENVIWIEAIPDVYDRLKANTKRFIKNICINACIGDEDGKEVEFNIASNDGQSSSFLEFGTHPTHHPSVVFINKVKMKTHRVDTLMKGLGFDVSDYNFLVIDLQGAELFALKGMGEELKKVKYAYLEVNRDELYKGCALVGEIDEYLGQFGLERVETKWTSAGWGDALFCQKKQ